MNTRTVLLGAVSSLAALSLVQAASIDRATLTEVVNSVSIIEPASKKTSAARTQQLFIAPNVLRTGANSRAEMVAPDQTVTRVGQSTLFSFEPNSREINLERGSILFQSPTGKGGGNIRTPAASAAVLGTTLIVTTTKNGGFKVLVVEGKGRVRAANGTTRILRGGQMVYALPGGRLSGILEFRLSQQVSASRLVGGFKKPLPSAAKIQAAINKQEKDIASGRATGTNLLASGSPNVAFRVDVAREFVVQDALDQTDPLTNATTTDAVVDSPTLEEGRIFSDGRVNGAGPGAVRTSNFGDDNAAPVRAARPASFVANNILFDTPNVSLAQAGDADVFQFLAINNIDFAGSTDFGMFTGEELQLLAGRTFTAAPNTALTANTPQFTLLALGSSFPLDGSLPESLEDIDTEVPLELTDFSATNTGGNLSIIGGDVSLTRAALEASETVRVTAAGNLNIQGVEGAEPVFDPDFVEVDAPAGLSTIRAREEVRVKGLGDVNLQRVAIRAPRVRVTSERTLKLTAVQINDGSVPIPPPQSEQPGPTFQEVAVPNVYLFAKDLADLRRVNFLSNDVLIQSNTVRLENVRFREQSRVILESAIGLLADNPNTNAPVQPGRVNFVRGVTYGSRPAQDAVIQNGPAPSPNGAGIIVRPIRGRPSN